MPEEAVLDHSVAQCRENPDGLKSWYVGGQLEWDVPHDGSRQTPPFVRHGVAKQYFPSGKLRMERPYVKGKPHGIEREFYPGGQVSSEIEFKEGEQDGVYRRFHANGVLDIEGTYVQGVLKGLVRRWHPDGTLWLEVTL